MLAKQLRVTAKGTFLPTGDAAVVANTRFTLRH
jgi:hypothetical protein